MLVSDNILCRIYKLVSDRRLQPTLLVDLPPRSWRIYLLIPLGDGESGGCIYLLSLVSLTVSTMLVCLHISHTDALHVSVPEIGKSAESSASTSYPVAPRPLLTRIQGPFAPSILGSLLLPILLWVGTYLASSPMYNAEAVPENWPHKYLLQLVSFLSWRTGVNFLCCLCLDHEYMIFHGRSECIRLEIAPGIAERPLRGLLCSALVLGPAQMLWARPRPVHLAPWPTVWAGWFGPAIWAFCGWLSLSVQNSPMWLFFR